MKPKEFVNKLLPFAEASEAKTGVNKFVTLAQAALESGWGEHAPGNMYFGVKDSDGLNGNEQLITTSEYSRRVNCTPKEVGLVTIISVTPVLIKGVRFFKYIGKGYFRKYNNPEESFTAHSELFLRAKVYSQAMAVKDDPIKFIDEMAKHYATAPNYAETIKKLYNQIKGMA